MAYLLLCVLVLLGSYGLNILYISVFYHRALTHRAVTIQPWLRKIVLETGNWVTGIDPKGWVCMHRLDHKCSDTARDPHSPLNDGVWKVLPMQLHSYKRALRGPLKGERKYTSMVPDLDFPVNWLNRRKVWYLPYLFHALFAIGVGIIFQAWLLATCYWLGMMSHPIQGWMVNALSHRYGYRNVATKWWEIDLGYALTWTLVHLGVLRRISAGACSGDGPERFQSRSVFVAGRQRIAKKIDAW